jgi:hypothetical protein
MEAIATNDGERKAPPDDISEMLLSALRCATLRAKLDANEFTTIGIALRSRAITPDDAIVWLTDAGLIGQVISEPIADAH